MGTIDLDKWEGADNSTARFNDTRELVDVGWGRKSPVGPRPFPADRSKKLLPGKPERPSYTSHPLPRKRYTCIYTCGIIITCRRRGRRQRPSEFRRRENGGGGDSRPRDADGAIASSDVCSRPATDGRTYRRRTFAMEKKSFLKTGDRSREKKHSVGFFRHPVNGRTAGGQARALRGENFVCKRPRFPSPDKRAATVGLKTSTCSFLLVPEPLPAVASSSSSRPHGPLLPSVTGSFSKF